MRTLPHALRAIAEAFEDGQMVEEIEGGDFRIHAEVLRQVAELAAKVAGIGDDVLAGEGDRALVGLLQRGDGAHQRRLAGAVGAEQAEQTVADFEGDVVEGSNAVGVRFGEIGY
jgi:hypothetical protein